MAKQIIVKGARQNNLKNVNVKIPKNKLVIITGLSGSGKSSLAFDIIYAEGYRRYVENLSAQARFFLNDVKKPKVDSIENLSPAIAIDQRRDAKNPRSTVGTILGVYNFLRILYAETGELYCPVCNKKLVKNDSLEILKYLKELPKHTEVCILAPWESKGDFLQQLKAVSNQGYSKVRVDGKIEYLKDLFDRNDLAGKKIDIMVDRFNVDKQHFDKERIIDSLEVASKLSSNRAIISVEDQEDMHYSQNYHCPKCNFTMSKLTAKNFSFNSPEGACEKCGGLGEVFQADINKIIPNKKLSILEGGIAPWSRLSNNGEGGRRKKILQNLARRYKFKLSDSISKLSKTAIDKIIFGDNQEMEIIDDNDKKISIKFFGVANEIEEKYNNRQTTSNELERYLTKKSCPICQGKRLKKEALAVKVFDKSIDELTFMEISELVDFFEAVQKKYQLDMGDDDKNIAERLVKEIVVRIKPVKEVGVDYLNLNRSVNTLSGGEFQRLRLSTQLQNGLSNLVYVLDEPSVGLHGRDIKNLTNVLRKICENGNTVIVVEHDREIIQSADYIIDIGPGAGKDGGEVVFAGTLQQLKKAKTETAKHLFEDRECKQKKKIKKTTKKLVIQGAQEHNLKNIDVEIPLRKMVTVTGVSGGGKSSLIIDILAKGLKRKLNNTLEEPGKHKKITGAHQLAKVVIVNQSPIGRSPRSNAATYTGIFNHIRNVFANTEMAKKKGLSDGYFSFNMKGGRCEYCQGEGVQKIEMNLLGDVYTECIHCHGSRYNKKVREVEYHGVNIVDVLNMSVEYAYHFFNSNNLITRKLQVLKDVGLGYLKLGQNATELSGGEAQRIKLATELIRQSNQGALYILDEPTVGLHFSDIERLLKMLNKLVEKGNSVIVVEHNTDVVCASDWVIELGPEGGNAGGRVVFQGTPDKLIKAKTATGKLFKK